MLPSSGAFPGTSNEGRGEKNIWVVIFGDKKIIRA